MVTKPITATSYVTEEELMALPSDARVEVVDGEFVEMSPVGEQHHMVVGNLHDILKPHAKRLRLGLVYVDGLIFILRPEERGLRSARIPDLSFVRKEKLPANRDIRRPLRIAPTLAVEVISPDEDPEEILKKVREYLDAGTEQVWLLFPVTRELHVYRRNSDTITTYRYGNDVMDVGDLFPGLTIALADVFAVDEWE